MTILKKITVLTLIASILCIYHPKEFYAQELLAPATVKIKIHDIEIRSTPNEPLTIVETKNSKWWLMGIIGAAVIGGAAALAGASGGEDSGDGETSPTSGSATVSW